MSLPQAVCPRQNHTFLQSPWDAVLPSNSPICWFQPCMEICSMTLFTWVLDSCLWKIFFSYVASEIIKPGNFNSGSFQVMSQDHEWEPCVFIEAAFCFRISFTAIPSLSVFHRQHDSLESSCSWQSCQTNFPTYIFAAARKAPIFR